MTKLYILLEKNIWKLVLVSIIMIFTLPFILTNPWFTLIPLGTPSEIGSIIGGITAPIIGLLTAFLLYLTFAKQSESVNNQILMNNHQIDFNNNLIYEANFRIIYDEIKLFKVVIFNFKLNNGRISINEFFEYANEFVIHKSPIIYDDIKSFHDLIKQFDRIFYLKNNLRTGYKYEEFLVRDILELYDNYFMQNCYDIRMAWKTNAIVDYNNVESDLSIGQLLNTISYLIDTTNREKEFLKIKDNERS